MLTSLNIQQFRCIEAAALEFAPGVNLISGANASGKTSLLEAIFFLGRARSFRTSRITPLVREGAKELMVAGGVTRANRTVAVGIRRSRNAAEMRVDGAPVRSLADLAQAFPVQVLDPTVHGLLDDGPRRRRRFLDWGVFHVEHGFQLAWQTYSRALRQRNVLLRAGAHRNELLPWERTLAEAGEQMDSLRRQYVDKLQPAFTEAATRLIGDGPPATIEYRQGWPDGLPLAEAIGGSLQSDRNTGYTRVGPHRADLAIRIGSHAAQDRVSRGQQKVLAGALVVTQLAEYQRATGQVATLLADDLPAELDPEYLARFVALVRGSASQLFITAIHPESLPTALFEEARRFHVKHGRIAAAAA